MKPRYSAPKKPTYRAPPRRTSNSRGTYRAPARSSYTRTTSRRPPARTTVVVRKPAYVPPPRPRYRTTVIVKKPVYVRPTTRVYINTGALINSALRRSAYYRTTNRRSKIVLRTGSTYLRSRGRRTVIIRRMARALATSMAVVAAGISALAF